MKKKIVIALFAIAAIVVVMAPSHKADAQVLYGTYCCDVNGARRCVLSTPAPVNTGCFCFGQGNGIVCL